MGEDDGNHSSVQDHIGVLLRGIVAAESVLEGEIEWVRVGERVQAGRSRLAAFVRRTEADARDGHDRVEPIEIRLTIALRTAIAHHRRGTSRAIVEM